MPKQRPHMPLVPMRRYASAAGSARAPGEPALRPAGIHRPFYLALRQIQRLRDIAGTVLAAHVSACVFAPRCPLGNMLVDAALLVGKDMLRPSRLCERRPFTPVEQRRCLGAVLWLERLKRQRLAHHSAVDARHQVVAVILCTRA